MSRFIKYADGVVFEISEPIGIEERAGIGDVIEEASGTFADIVNLQVKPAALQIVSALRSVSPDQVEIEFGIKMAGQVGAVFAKSSTDVHLVVKVKWGSTHAPK